MTVIKAPMKRRYHRTVAARDIWSQKEPSPEMVWEICPYLKSFAEERRCLHCPTFEFDHDFGEEVQRGCYGMAAEVCRIVFAMQKRETSEYRTTPESEAAETPQQTRSEGESSD